MAIRLDDGAVVTCDAVLFAEWREATTEQLGCDAAGIRLGKYGRILIDAEHRTTHPAVYAIGDVIGPPGLASAAVQQGKDLAHQLLAAPRITRSRRQLR
ncbi:MAG: FAD-dependent oxidoreductase [Actinomycetota bacterium]|nr:FAD-dependent oxidoreductase [Actinomycetota bacterium]